MGKRKLILVADDSVTARSYLCSLLEKAGYETIQAGDGNKAIDILGGVSPSCMILDLLMPELNGFEVLAKLQEMNVDFPVVILSADIQEEVKKECFDLGAKSFINKPFKEKEIIDLLAGIIK